MTSLKPFSLTQTHHHSSNQTRTHVESTVGSFVSDEVVTLFLSRVKPARTITHSFLESKMPTARLKIQTKRNECCVRNIYKRVVTLYYCVVCTVLLICQLFSRFLYKYIIVVAKKPFVLSIYPSIVCLVAYCFSLLLHADID